MMKKKVVKKRTQVKRKLTEMEKVIAVLEGMNKTISAIDAMVVDLRDVLIGQDPSTSIKVSTAGRLLPQDPVVEPTARYDHDPQHPEPLPGRGRVQTDAFDPTAQETLNKALAGVPQDKLVSKAQQAITEVDPDSPEGLFAQEKYGELLERVEVEEKGFS